jgi:hypothetical protein
VDRLKQFTLAKFMHPINPASAVKYFEIIRE